MSKMRGFGYWSWVAAACLLATLARAGEPYVGVSIGESRPAVSTPLGDAEASSRWGYAATVGVRWRPRFATELDYTEFGHGSAAYSLPPALASQHAVSLSALLRQPVGPIDLLVKIGAAALESEAHYLLPYVRCTPSTPDCAQVNRRVRTLRPLLGIGLQWQPADRWQVRLQVERVGLGGAAPAWASVGLYRDL